jgi:hypothetical protein
MTRTESPRGGRLWYARILREMGIPARVRGVRRSLVRRDRKGEMGLDHGSLDLRIDRKDRP